MLILTNGELTHFYGNRNLPAHNQHPYGEYEYGFSLLELKYWGFYINTSYMLLKYILPPVFEVCCTTVTEMDAVLLSLISAA